MLASKEWGIVDNQEMTAFEYAINVGFVLGGLVSIVLLAGLWFTVLRKKTQKPYPVPQMLAVAFVAQVIGVFNFFN